MKVVSKKIIVIATSLLTFIMCLNCFELKSYAASNEQQVYNYLTKNLGFNTAAACGIMANIELESGFVSTKGESGGGGYGLCQWTGSRKTKLIKYCKDNKLDYTSISGQLEYLRYELEKSYSNLYKSWKSCSNNAEGAYSVGYDWCMKFEKPEYKDKVHGQYDANGNKKTNGGYDYFKAYGKTYKCIAARIGLTESQYRGQIAQTKYWTKYSSSYVEIAQDNYYLKNASTSTYLNISGGKAANGQAATLSAKQNSNSFKFYASGSKEKGYNLLSLIDKNYALNPYSDTPSDGTKITLYKKSTDGTQLYFFEPSGSGYIIHNAYNENLVLTPSGSNVLLKTKTGAANQVWVLESINTTVEIPQGDYYLKNASAGTYLNISGGKAANGQAATLSTKQNSNSFKFCASGSKDKGYYLLSLIDKNYALNPYSDTPGDGTKITLYKKSTDGTQLYFFEPSGSGYIIHNAYNQNLVLTPSGSNVLLKTKTGTANQVWVLESANTTTVKFHRNLNSDDDTTVSEKFTVGVANQKFGYNTDGTGRYEIMNDSDVGFGQWINPGYKLLGWSTDKNATARDWTTYSAVTDNWIKIYAPSVDLYAVWQKETLLGDLNDDKEVSVSDVALLQKYIVNAEKLTETQWILADMNSDGRVDVFDCIILKRVVLKII